MHPFHADGKLDSRMAAHSAYIARIAVSWLRDVVRSNVPAPFRPSETAQLHRHLAARSNRGCSKLVTLLPRPSQKMADLPDRLLEA
jgi:hypothetical protein